MTMLVVLAFVLGIGSGVALTKVKSRGPVNIVRGVLLPHPNDERWEALGRSFCVQVSHPDYHAVLSCGDVVVMERHGATVDGVPVPGSGRYGRAVLAAHLERKSLAAALGDS